MSFRKAVDEKCKDCIYDPLAGGTWRQQVEACEMRDCSLWPLRPITRKKDPTKPKGPLPPGLARHAQESRQIDGKPGAAGE